MLRYIKLQGKRRKDNMVHIGFQKRESLMITGVDLIRRDEFSASYWDNAGGARWAFFAIFVILIIIVLLGTLRVNKKRARQGLQPVYGTRWMTPPSYGQSQHQYDQPDHRRDPDLPSAYVPTYTATANEYDMGYYDANGVFHANPNAKSPIPQPPKVHQRSESTTVTDENSHNTPGGTPIASNLPHDLTGNNQHVDDNDSIGDFYRPPQGPPPNRNLTSTSPENTNTNTETTQNHTSNITTESMPGSFLRPSGPPPQSSSSSPSLPQNATGNEIREFDNPIPTSSSTSTPSNGDSLPNYSEGSNPPIIKEKN